MNKRELSYATTMTNMLDVVETLKKKTQNAIGDYKPSLVVYYAQKLQKAVKKLEAMAGEAEGYAMYTEATQKMNDELMEE